MKEGKRQKTLRMDGKEGGKEGSRERKTKKKGMKEKEK